jgi:DNA-directed RNA polymerase specialized sigma24 family protein
MWNGKTKDAVPIPVDHEQDTGVLLKSTWYLQEHARLTRHATRWLRPPLDAEDLASSIFLEHWIKTVPYMPPTQLQIKHRCFDVLRRARLGERYRRDLLVLRRVDFRRVAHRDTEIDLVDIADTASTVDTADLQQEQNQQLLGRLMKIAGLDTTDMSLLYKLYYAEQDYQSIAAELCLTIDACRLKQRDILARLQAAGRLNITTIEYNKYNNR